MLLNNTEGRTLEACLALWQHCENTLSVPFDLRHAFILHSCFSWPLWSLFSTEPLALTSDPRTAKLPCPISHFPWPSHALRWLLARAFLALSYQKLRELPSAAVHGQRTGLPLGDSGGVSCQGPLTFPSSEQLSEQSPVAQGHRRTCAFSLQSEIEPMPCRDGSVAWPHVLR